jgi:hypothetical protein
MCTVKLRRVRVNIVAGGGRGEISIKYYECVCGCGCVCVCVCVCVYSCLSYPACKAQAPYYIAIRGLPGSTTLFHIISSHKPHGEKIIDHSVWAMILSTIFVRNISHSTRNERDIITNVQRS